MTGRLRAHRRQRFVLPRARSPHRLPVVDVDGLDFLELRLQRDVLGLFHVQPEPLRLLRRERALFREGVPASTVIFYSGWQCFVYVCFGRTLSVAHDVTVLKAFLLELFVLPELGKLLQTEGTADHQQQEGHSVPEEFPVCVTLQSALKAVHFVVL